MFCRRCCYFWVWIFSLILTQNFTLTKDELGVTGVKDLSTSDMEKVRSLSLIELTALFDSHGLALHRRKPIKKRVKGKKGTGIVFSFKLECFFFPIQTTLYYSKEWKCPMGCDPFASLTPQGVQHGLFFPEGHPSSYLFVEQGLTGMNRWEPGVLALKWLSFEEFNKFEIQSS